MPNKIIPICTYLRLPLHYRQIRKVDIQPLIDTSKHARANATENLRHTKTFGCIVINKCVTSLSLHILTKLHIMNKPKNSNMQTLIILQQKHI